MREPYPAEGLILAGTYLVGVISERFLLACGCIRAGNWLPSNWRGVLEVTVSVGDGMEAGSLNLPVRASSSTQVVVCHVGGWEEKKEEYLEDTPRVPRDPHVHAWTGR